MEKGSSSVSRRRLLAWASLGLAGLGAVGASALNRSWFVDDARGGKSWWNGSPRSLDRAGFQEWSRQVGSAFELHGEAGPVPLKLVEVTPLPSKGERPQGVSRDRAFLAVFEQGSGTLPSGNQTYQLRHGGGSLDIFFDPASAGAPTRLHAVFN